MGKELKFRDHLFKINNKHCNKQEKQNMINFLVNLFVKDKLSLKHIYFPIDNT